MARIILMFVLSFTFTISLINDSFAQDNQVEVNASEQVDEMVNDEGYSESDDEYNEAELNAQVPDEYFNDEQFLNEIEDTMNVAK